MTSAPFSFNNSAILANLVSEPRENLEIEVKEWLDLSGNEHRAGLAKEIIALANHGGGYVVIGFTELDDGSFEVAENRPENLAAWSQDSIQGIIPKYVDPNIHCNVSHIARGESGEKHPVIVVPGGHRIPLRAKAGGPDNKKLVSHRMYIRRPGPKSEEPQSAEEWDGLLERILQNRKSELIEAFRSIMAGELPGRSSPTPTRLDQLIAFEQKAISRWNERVSSLPKDAPPRFPLGFYEITLAIDGEFEHPTLANLRDIIRTEVRSHSGWPPFLTIDRSPHTPSPVDGAVEFWRGPESRDVYDVPSHHDFWRISPDGLFFTRRGYQEDGGYNQRDPGKYFDITAPTWRLSEAILEATYIARAMQAEAANLIMKCRWIGLASRELASFNSNRFLGGQHVIKQNSYEVQRSVAISTIPDALPELVFSMLSPLYELFNFFRLPKRLVEEEIATLLKNRY